MAPTSKTRRNAKPESRKEQVDQRLIKALGHPTRTRALAILNERVASPKELAQEIGDGLSQVSYHVRVLLDCGYIELVKTKPRRGATEHYYRGVRRALLPDEAWRKLPPQIKQGISIGVLNETFEDAAESLKAGTFDERKDRHLSWTPLIVDGDGWRELTSLLAETLERAFDIQAESAARLSGAAEESIAATLAMMGFESARGAGQGAG